MLKRRICSLLLLCFAFNNLNFIEVTNQSELQNSREFFTLFKLVHANDEMDNEEIINETKLKKKTEFDAKTYTDMYIKEVEKYYSQFRKSYKENLKMLSKVDTSLNPIAYKELKSKQSQATRAFISAFGADAFIGINFYNAW